MQTSQNGQISLKEFCPSCRTSMPARTVWHSCRTAGTRTITLRSYPSKFGIKRMDSLRGSRQFVTRGYHLV